ncbi:MAG TPA: HDOD domain-containing protein [Candidatus Solibacter sp.]|nr:HDOD domain-containing protein [Candidatus Solibacter sp.]
MNSPVQPANLPPQPTASHMLAEQERRKKRLTGILSQDLPTLPNYVMDLNALLSSPTVDLKKVGKVIRTDPSLSAQVLRLCNSALFGLRRRVLSIEQAAILLGTERLRTLVLTCSLMQFAGKRVPSTLMVSFWQHSFLTALLSERIARQVDYFEKEQAYLCGLLHDIGQLPLSILVLEEEAKKRRLPPENWLDNVLLEREYFGMDHCKVGRWMAVAWNFMPSYVDVFEHHHAPERAEHDPYLVGIIAAADQFLITQTADIPPLSAEPPSPQVSASDSASLEPEGPTFLEACLPQIPEPDRQAVLEMLQTEYIHLLPLVQIGLSNSAAGPELKQDFSPSAAG